MIETYRIVGAAEALRLEAEGWEILRVRECFHYYQCVVRERKKETEMGMMQEIDPARAPQRPDELPSVEAMLDKTLMSLSSRDTLLKIRSEVLEMAGTKGQLYQDARGVDSCLKRGFVGVFQNLARKWDRLEAFAQRYEAGAKAAEREAELDGGARPEVLRATLFDLAVYTLHALRFVEMFIEMPGVAPPSASELRGEAKRLAKYLIDNFPERIGPTDGEVDVAIRLMDEIRLQKSATRYGGANGRDGEAD